MTSTMMPIAMPRMTRTDLRRVIILRRRRRRWRRRRRPRPAASTISERSRCSEAFAHLITMNCRVAPAPQNRVVTASEIWPSLSRQSSIRQWLNSWIRYQGFFFSGL